MKTTSRALLVTGSYSKGHAVRDILRGTSQGVSLEIAPSQPAFVDIFRKNRPDLLVVDQDGALNVSPLDVIDQGHRQPSPIPVIVVGIRSDEQAFRALQRGAVEVLRDFELDRLPCAMERALEETRPARSLPEQVAQSSQPADAMRENQKMATIGRLAASIAHEINNPLESITNLLFLIGSDAMLSSDTRNYLQMAQHELERVVQISTQTLNFYRESPVPVQTDLSHLLDEVLVLYARRIAAKHLVVVKEYDATTRVNVFPGEMRQVFSNLVTNAIEASHVGGRLRLRTRSARHWTDGGVCGLRVSIADSGSGIDPQIRRRLGEPFFTTKGERGTGLGLWVTQSIVERYGGNLQLHSSVREQQHGTVFTVFLPTNLRPTIMPPGRAADALDNSGRAANAEYKDPEAPQAERECGAA